MKRLIGAGFISMLLGSTAAFAAEQTVKLAVDGMTCASCPYQVEAALKKVEGVTKIEVSLEQKQAIVTLDDEKASIAALTKATTDAGFPSALAKDGG